MFRFLEYPQALRQHLNNVIQCRRLRKGANMKHTTKLLALLLALIMVLGATMLTSCDSGDQPGADTTTPTIGDQTTTPAADTTPAETTPAPTVSKDLVVVKDGDSTARVIRSENAAAASTQVVSAADIRVLIQDKTGVAPKIDTDWVKKGQEHDHELVEILVGNTDYSESQEVYSQLTYGQYMVKVVGNKLVVAGYSDKAITEAARQAKKIIEQNSTEGNLVIPADTYATGVVDNMLNQLPGYENGDFDSTYSCGVGGTLLLLTDTTMDAYKAYLTKLSGAGFTQYTTNEINGNSFATYTNDKYTVNLGFYDYEDSARIIIEPLAKPVGLKEENVYTKVTTPQITMLGLEAFKNGAGNGLSMIVRLSDGRFIIIDGGFSNNATDANLIIKQLKEQSKDYLKSGEKITVAAWIITHAHGDHSGMIVTQYGLFKNVIKLERMLGNIMSDAERNKAIELDPENRWSAGEGGQSSKLDSTAKALGGTYQQIHVGQVFYYADVKLDILYTVESFAPKICNAFNTSSNTIKFTFDSGDTFLMTGDTTGNGMQIAAKMFGDYLQSDLLQVAHHGYSTHGNDSGMIYAYKYVDPPTLLWPQGKTANPNYTGKGYNKVLFSKEMGGDNPNYKETLLAGMEGDVIICPIPYEVGKAIVTRATK